MKSLRTLSFAIGCVVLSGLAMAAAPGSAEVSFDIPAQSLSDALNAFGRQAGVSVAFYDDAVADRTATAIAGTFTVEEALGKLLGQSGLHYRFVNEKTVAISGEEKTGGRTLREGAEEFGIRVAQSGESQSPVEAGATREEKLEEIVVTAQKRVERLQDVPVPVTAIAADSLVNSNQMRLQDYYSRVPGLNLTFFGDGFTPQVTIRGVTTGGLTNPTVSAVVDDIPFGPSVFGQGSFEIPDFDPSDLARVEVLRGPQGTLYGASSMGGLIKYVTIDPSTERLSGRVQAGFSSVSSGDTGYNVRGSVNVPLSDTWAIRASAFTREDGGYIDNIQSGENDVNSLESKGGRLAAMWRPNDNFSLKLAAVFQDTNTNGSPAADLSLLAPLGDLQQRRLADTGGYDKKMRLFSAALTAKLGAGELVSVTGYGVNTIFTHLDISAIGFLAQPIFGSASVRSDVQYDTDKLTQELRYSLSIGERVQWLIGAFYTDESTDQDQVTPVIGATPVADPVTGEPVGYFFKTHSVRTFEERAAFTNLTFDVTDRLDVQVGGRWSENKIQNGAQSRRGFIYCSTAANRLCAAPANANYAGLNPEANAGDSPITYLLTPRFRVSPDLMLYARFASGYRPGGPNSNPSFLISAGAPLEYESDTTQNYELGIKGSLWDRRLTFEASVYHIQWKDIQLSFRQPNPPFATFNVNGGEAKSEGVELSVESKPLRGLTLSGWVSLGEAELTEDFPVGSVLAGSKGDRLPLSSRNSANFSVDQEFPIGSVTAFVGGTVSHIGEREDVFRAPGLARFNLPAYTQVDLRAGVRYESWAVNLFGTNITDKRGFLVGDPSVGGAVIYTQPRTVGLSLEKSF